MSKSAILVALEEFRRSISASIDQLTVELHHSSYGFPRYTSPSPSWSPFPPDLSFNSQPTLLPPPPRSEPPPPSMFQPPLPQTPPPTIPPQPTEAAPPETLLLPATPTSPLRLQTAPSVADDPSCRGEEEVARGGEEVWFDSATGFDGCAGFVEFLFAGQPVWLCGEPHHLKADEPVPHPPKDQLPNVSFCITSPPPWPEAILLGFQHYLVMLGTTVIIPTALVPQMGGGNEEKAKVIQTLLFVSGLNTLLQTWFGTRLPVVIGGSYTFVAPTISIILSGRWNDSDPVSRIKKIMRATQSALIVASTIQIVLGFNDLWRNVAIFLSSIPAVPLVALAGFGLYDFGFPGVAKCVEIGLPLLIVIVWISAHLLTVGGAFNGKPPKTQASCRTDCAGLIDAAPWIRVPYPFQWGAPSFDAGEAFAMMMAAVEQSLFPNHMKRELGTSQGGLELLKKLHELRGEFAVSFRARA